MTRPSSVDRRSTIVIHCGSTSLMIFPYRGVPPQYRELGPTFLKPKSIVVDRHDQRMRLKEIYGRDYIRNKWDPIAYRTSQENVIAIGWMQSCDAMWRCEGTRGSTALYRTSAMRIPSHTAKWRCEDAKQYDAIRSHITYRI